MSGRECVQRELALQHCVEDVSCLRTCSGLELELLYFHSWLPKFLLESCDVLHSSRRHAGGGGSAV